MREICLNSKRNVKILKKIIRKNEKHDILVGEGDEFDEKNRFSIRFSKKKRINGASRV